MPSQWYAQWSPAAVRQVTSIGNYAFHKPSPSVDRQRRTNALPTRTTKVMAETMTTNERSGHDSASGLGLSHGRLPRKPVSSVSSQKADQPIAPNTAPQAASPRSAS